MSVCDTYVEIKTVEKEELFTELFELKSEKKLLDKRIKELEKGYKEEIVSADKDLFFKLKNGIKFSIRKSERKGSIDIKAIERKTGINCEDFRMDSTTIHTLRIDEQ